jgi:ABC-type multidrug transport system ATPase subunit
MKVQLQNIGKRFNRDWVFQEMSMEFDSQTCTAIIGGNGSGKSTLLQILSGYLSPSAGSISWQLNNTPVRVEELYKQLSWATPYVSVYDEFTLKENVEFFLKFKSLRNGMGVNEFAEIVQLQNQINKPLKQYSSGMRQRVKLGLAILADTPLLLLDEPTSHLDAHYSKWYQTILSENQTNRTIFIASNNNADEIFLCKQNIEVERWKK